MNKTSSGGIFFLSLALFFLISLTEGEKCLFEIKAETMKTEQAKPELVTQTGHTSPIISVVFSPDNKWIASGDFDNTIKIWEASSGRELRVLTGHAGAVNSLLWSSDGKLLASGSNDKTVRLWNVVTGQQIYSLNGQSEAVEVVALSQNGQLIAAESSDQTIRIWETATGREIKNLALNGNRVSALAFSPNGVFLAAGNTDNTIKIWEIGKQKKPKVLKKHTDRIKILNFSPDGQFLASGGFDNTVRIWKFPEGSEIYKYTGHAGKILAINFLSQNEIVSADINQKIKFWNPLTGSETRITVMDITADNLIEAESAAFSPDGRKVVFGYGDRTAILVDAASGKKILKLKNHTSGFNSVSFSGDKRFLALGSLDNTIKLWDLQTGQSLSPLAGHDGYIRSIAFHPDNQRIISASIDKTIKIWNFTTGDAHKTFGSHAGAVNSIAVSGSGKWLVSGSVDRTVKIWDLTSGKATQTLLGHINEVTSVAISPDERLIASASVDKTVKIWNLAAPGNPQTLSGHTDSVESVTFSPDGKLLASASADKTIKIWDVASGQHLSALTGHLGKITSVSFRPDGQWLTSGSEDKTVRIWRVSDGSQLKLLEGHVGIITSTNFSSDGKWLTSASTDGNVNIWQVDAASKLATLVSLRENNDWLVVSPNGFFDGSPTAFNQLLWRFSGDTFNFSPVEVFFNEFYRPGLLADLLAGKHFDSTGDISKKDRRQPQIKISFADGESSATKITKRNIQLKIEVEETRFGNKNEEGSGARDVRLFRNGSLVRFWDGDVLSGRNSKTVFEETVPIVDGENHFTAYAFNHDNIKSEDANLTLIGAENLKKKGMTYIFAIGVGKYANPEFNLSYIESDVKLFGEILRLKQEELNSDERIKVFPLLDEQATKNNILETLKRFTGKNTGERSSLPFSEQPEAVQPEDTLIVYFSGHGVARENRFYMIPFDLGYIGKREDLSEESLKTLTNNFISDSELEEAFRQIDAKNLLLVIDACNSGQALESSDKRQGPMNSKGLAQLAYEKGMYILTAAQSAEDAYVSQVLKHSYLTYALVEEGLKSAVADKKPADGKLLLREWFDYAGERVPQMRQEELNKEQSKGFESGNKNKQAPRGAGGNQRPRIFYRRFAEQQPMIVARFPSVKQ